MTPRLRDTIRELAITVPLLVTIGVVAVTVPAHAPGTPHDAVPVERLREQRDSLEAVRDSLESALLDAALEWHRKRLHRAHYTVWLMTQQQREARARMDSVMEVEE